MANAWMGFLRWGAKPSLALMSTCFAWASCGALLPRTTLAQNMPSGRAQLESSSLPAQSESAAPVRSSSTPIVENSYVLGAGDQIELVLFRLPEYSGTYEVQVDGRLNLARVGAIAVDGLTIEQATAAISNAYSQLLRRPIVTLNLVSRRPLEIGIAGEINRPGSYVLEGDDGGYPTLTRLLQTAEGITPSADLRNVQITRREGGQTRVLQANLWELLTTGNLSQDIVLRDGDSIFIPSTLVPLDESALVADANFYADVTEPINIAVVGEVFRPGPYRLRGGATRTGDAGVPGGEGGDGNAVTVTDAIQVAGGIKPLANIRQVEVRRTPRYGDQESFTVDLWSLLQTGDLKQNAILQEGDTVVIPTATAAIPAEEASQTAAATFSPNSIRINVVGEVTRPGQIEVPPNTPLNQGLLAAGGFNNRAREDVVGLVRLNPDGTVTQRELNVDFAQGISEDGNPVLQNNDIIIVGTSGLADFSDTLGAITSPIADFLFILGAPFNFFNLFD